MNVDSGETALFGHTLPVHLGDLPGEARAARSKCVWISFPWDGFLSVTGEERTEFLQAMLTQDLALPAGRTVPAALADRKGAWLADLWVHIAADHVRLHARRDQLDVVRSSLDRHRFASRVAWEDLGSPDDRTYHLCGPGSAAAAEQLGLDYLEGIREGGDLSADGASGVWLRVREISHADFICIVPGREARRFEGRLASLDPPVAPIGWNAFNLARIMAGTPWHGLDGGAHDLVPEIVPPDRVSLGKGCFLGQETIARVHHRGRVRRRLVRARIESLHLPAPGAEILANPGGCVGWITSAAFGPEGKPFALAFRRAGSPDEGGRLADGSRVHWLDLEEVVEVSRPAGAKES